MTKEHPNRIAEIRKAKGLTQAQLADKLEVHWVTISKLERGKIQLHTGWMDAIAEALEVSPVSLISTNAETFEIAINGSLNEEGRFLEFADENSEREEFLVDVPLQPIGSEGGFWAVVEGDRYWPFFHDQDKLLFTPIETESSTSFIGRFFIAHLVNGDMPAGYLAAVSEDGRIDLQQINGKTLRNLRATDLAMLVSVRFAWPLEPVTHPKPHGRWSNP